MSTDSSTHGWFTLGDVLAGHATTGPDDVALVCGSDRLSWRALDQRVDALVGVLGSRGAGPGERVLWLGQNCHRLLEALFATARLGAALCPVNWRQRPEELRFVLEDADPVVVLWQAEEIGDAVAAVRPPSGSGAWIGHDDPGVQGYEALLGERLSGGSRTGRLVDSDEPRQPVDANRPARPVDPGGPVLMLYTAAFDGQPNGALLSHTALLSQTTTLRLLEGVGADEVFLNSGPLFHIGTLRRTLAVLHAGGRNVMLRRVVPEELGRLVEAEGCTSAFLQRPTMEQLVEHNRDGRFDLSSLRTPPGPPGWDDMVTVVRGPRVRSGYGQTELAGVVTFALPERPTVGGLPGPLAAVEVLDPAGAPVPAGQTGEIAVRGPMVMNGYHRRPELSAAKRRHGWHHTGDLGRREADGSISFVGPLRKMIKSAAENVYPAEVEAALRRHPGVSKAAVIGVPDATWGQRVLAVVVPAAGLAAEWRGLVDALTEHCRAELAGYRRPRLFELVDELPTRAGAVDYDALDTRFGGGGYPGEG
ncbi:MAG TPA: AMP-binding protein, partial [Pseudonocardia sp.]|nr:AMP-binding protein [Pseudonocardia sp.]